MDDAARVRVRQRLQHLRGDLDRVAVAQALGAKHLAERPSLDELVGDVDVTLVLAEVVGTNAAGVAKP